MAATVVMLGAGAAALVSPPGSDEVAGDDREVVIPDQDDLQDADGGQQDGDGPRVTCEQGGEEVSCVSWTHQFDSASVAPDLHAWQVDVTSDRVLARDAETVVALSRASGQQAWRKGYDTRIDGVWMLDEEITAVQTGTQIHGLSLIDGTELWSVDDAHVPFPGRDDRPTTLFTIQPDDGESVLAAHEADGTVRWRRTVAEDDPRTTWTQVRLLEVGPAVFMIQEGSDHDMATIALDESDGAERWRRADSRPLHATDDLVVMLDVARNVEEHDDDTVTVSESPAALVAIDATDGSRRWQQDAGPSQEFGIVADTLVRRGTDALTGVDLATGKRRWQRDVAEDERLVGTTTPWAPSVSQHRRMVTFESSARRVIARDPATGEALWQTQLDQFVGHVSMVDGAILARQSGTRSSEGDTVTTTTVVHLDPATGDVRGTITTESDGDPRFVAHDVLVDPRNGWAVHVDLPDP